MKFPLFSTKRISIRSLVALLVLACWVSEAAAQKLLSTGKLESRAPDATVTPIEIPGNPNCSTLNADNAQFPTITTENEFRIDSPFSHGGPWPYQSSGNRILIGPTDLSHTLTTSGTTTTLNFNSTMMISAVMIKAGSSSNVYYYPSGSFGDTNLVVAQNSISHVTFCYIQPATVNIIKTVTTSATPPNNTSSSFLFGFSATGLSSPSFSLTDQNVVGPDRFIQTHIYTFAPSTITVTENATPSNWTLADISCVEDDVQDSTDNFPIGRTATIRLQQAEIVTCTFHNTQLAPSAAPAQVSGRVLDSFGRGISGARLSLLNGQDGTSWSAITNQFGYYMIDGPEVGNFYVMTVSHKRYSFADNTRSFTLNEDLAGLDFVASP